MMLGTLQVILLIAGLSAEAGAAWLTHRFARPRTGHILQALARVLFALAAINGAAILFQTPEYADMSELGQSTILMALGAVVTILLYPAADYILAALKRQEA